MKSALAVVADLVAPGVGNDRDADELARRILDALGIGAAVDLDQRHYIIHRADGEALFDEHAWIEAAGPSDWTMAEVDSDDADGPVEYEIVTVLYTHTTTRTFGCLPGLDELAAG